MKELLGSNQAPLILAGVDEDVAIYRSINSYPNLLEQGIPGSPGKGTTPAQILRQAHDIALFDTQRRAAQEMSESKEHLAPARISADLESILRAAAEGRVSRSVSGRERTVHGKLRRQDLRRPHQLA